MGNEQMQTARKMAAKLFRAEEAIDRALTEVAELAGFMPIARMNVRVTVGVGQEALAQAIAALGLVAQARQCMVDTHAALAATQADIGMRERNFGGFINKPPNKSFALSIVQSESTAA